jgi:hypothetical protein
LRAEADGDAAVRARQALSLPGGRLRSYTYAGYPPHRAAAGPVSARIA